MRFLPILENGHSEEQALGSTLQNLASPVACVIRLPMVGELGAAAITAAAARPL